MVRKVLKVLESYSGMPIKIDVENMGNDKMIGQVNSEVQFLNATQIKNLLNINYDEILGKPTFNLVATSGDYNDLTNTPVLNSVATSGDYNDLTNTPVLNSVATSGQYNDLLNKPNLSSVATSGDYNDLINTPSGTGSGRTELWSGEKSDFGADVSNDIPLSEAVGDSQSVIILAKIEEVTVIEGTTYNILFVNNEIRHTGTDLDGKVWEGNQDTLNYISSLLGTIVGTPGRTFIFSGSSWVADNQEPPVVTENTSGVRSVISSLRLTSPSSTISSHKYVQARISNELLEYINGETMDTDMNVIDVNFGSVSASFYISASKDRLRYVNSSNNNLTILKVLKQ